MGQKRSPKQLYHITLMFGSKLSRSVPVKASSREKAEKRALKFNPQATGIKKE